jgi:hypothetical protein
MKRREGQSLVLGALMILILSLATLATLNIGHNITERVRLQNTADASAYSMAAMEARAFNFYAFANRTQVSHYVAAMVWQSMLSFAYFLEAAFTDLLGVVLTADICNPQQSDTAWKLICAAAKLIPPPWGTLLQAFFAVLTQIAAVIEVAVRMIQDTLRATDIDAVIGKVIIPAHQILNKALAGLSELTLVGTMENVVTTSNDVITDNDVNVDSTLTRALSGALSVCILERAHMQESGVSLSNAKQAGNIFKPLDPKIVDEQSKVARAKRSMGKISNATRFACDNDGNGSLCGGGWVTQRTAGQLIPLPSNFGIVRNLVDAIDWKWGQTKMLSYGLSTKDKNGNDRNYIRDWKTDFPKSPAADLAQGDAMGSDDIYQVKLGPDQIGVSLPLAGFVGVDNPFSCKDTDDSLKCWGDNRKGLGNSAQADLPYMHMLKPSIWAMSDGDSGVASGGLHWRVVTDKGVSGSKPSDLPNKFSTGTFGGTPNTHRDIGLNVWEKKVIDIFVITVKLPVWVANTRRIEDGNHPWEGLARFPHFEPGLYEEGCSLLGTNFGNGPNDAKGAADRDHGEFNQPSTWTILVKNSDELKNPKKGPTGAGSNRISLLNNNGQLDFKMSKGQKLVFDNKKGNFLGYAGMTVMSRGQTYYHRPGNWAEQPNFFNPYWKPRLASVWQGRSSLPSLVTDVANALPAPLNGLPPKIITH